MHTVILQHVPFEGPGSILTSLERHRGTVHTCHLYLGEPLPQLTQCDLLVVMGGPMSVNDEVEHPWLREEKRLLGEAVTGQTPTLGVCLGAQLIAAALGARVYPNRHREIGWFPITATPAEGEMFHFPSSAMAFHWHGETFDLPDNARCLAASNACRNQAFQVGRRVIGLQCHLEATAETVGLMLTHNASDLLTEGPYIQDPGVINAATPERYAEINALMARLLDYLLAGLSR